MRHSSTVVANATTTAALRSAPGPPLLSASPDTTINSPSATMDDCRCRSARNSPENESSAGLARPSPGVGQPNPNGCPHLGTLPLVARCGSHEEEVATDLDGDVRPGEDQATRAERVRRHECQHKATEHAADEKRLYRRLVRVEPVGDPRRVAPHPPQGEQQHHRLESAAPAQVVQ
jgi:hypothetical protein